MIDLQEKISAFLQSLSNNDEIKDLCPESRQCFQEISNLLNIEPEVDDIQAKENDIEDVIDTDANEELEQENVSDSSENTESEEGFEEQSVPKVIDFEIVDSRSNQADISVENDEREEELTAEDAKQEKEESEKQLAGFGIAYDEEIENLALTNGESKSSKTSGPMLIYSNKNGMVGKAYDYLVEDICDFEHKIIEITGISDIGLIYDPLLREISGTPTQAGEFELTLQYTREESDAIHDNVKLCFFILPDPQSMWKNVEPPADSLFKKAHFESLHETFHENRIYGGSLRGRSHAHAGTFRDDDFTIGIVSPDCLVLAVADGAGSAEFSREGSRIACDRVLDVARKAYADKSESLWQMLEDMQVEMSHEIKQKVSSELHLTIGEMVKSSIEGIEESAAQYEHSIRQYATTLLFAIVFKLEENYFIATYSIGDGAIGLVNDDTFKLLSSPDSGEFSGQTMFLTMKDSLAELNDRTKFSYLENLNGLCLMTDGISDPKFGTDSNLRKAEKWQELIGDVTTAGFCGAEYNEELFENWLGFFSKGDHDDRTIVFIV